MTTPEEVAAKDRAFKEAYRNWRAAYNEQSAILDAAEQAARDVFGAVCEPLRRKSDRLYKEWEDAFNERDNE